MAKKKVRPINRALTKEERSRLAAIREGAKLDYPPVQRPESSTPPGIPAAVRAAREAQGLTWYALAQKAGIPNQATIRDIEQGKDVKLSNLKMVAEALGLTLELLPASGLIRYHCMPHEPGGCNDFLVPLIRSDLERASY